jgi:plastocyanin
MGIVIAFVAYDQDGPDPFATPPPTSGEVTHGQLPEATNYGGDTAGELDPSTFPDGQTIDDRVGIGAFTYQPGNIGSPSSLGLPPVVRQGQPLTFDNEDAAAQIFHTVTACRQPCSGATGVSYPLANGPVEFDSGELGYGPTGLTAAANRYEWQVDTAKLAPGTYTYFCRVHPFMRGAFRVAP